MATKQVNANKKMTPTEKHNPNAMEIVNDEANVKDKPTSIAREGKSRHAYSETLLTNILIRVADGESINHICSATDMPSRSTFFDWVAKDLTIKTRYELAMMLRADLYAEEIIQIADDASGDAYIDDNGIVHTNYENIARSKLRVDARKWFASKFNPKKYGDRTVLEGNKDAPLQVESKTTIDLGTNFDKYAAHLKTKFNIELDLSD